MMTRGIRLPAGAIVFSAAIQVGGLARGETLCVPSPDSSSCTVTFSRTYTGNYRYGEPYDFITISPDGRGETFAEMGIAIRVCLKDACGRPLVGVPAQQITLYNSALCLCPGGNIADAPTDVNGCTTFSGTIRGGGCAYSLDVFVGGTFICTLRDAGGRTVKVNSPDIGPPYSGACFVDAADVSALGQRLGRVTGPFPYHICFDYNESGPPTINASDVAFFAHLVSAGCE